MPTPALLLIIGTLLPLASFTLLVFVGKRMGRPLAGIVATAAIGAAFLCSVFALMDWVNGGEYAARTGMLKYGKDVAPISQTMHWVPVDITAKGTHFLDVGIYIDSATIVMFSMVTLVATLVHIFSIGYMAEDKRFARFFTYLGLFCFSMLGLVIGGTLLQLFIFWELVGLCSYLLIGFWFEKKSASNAAIKAFVTNRVGDFGFLIGLGILFYHLGNVTLPEVWKALDSSKAVAGEGITLANGVVFGYGLLTAMGIGLFFGAVGKSAQFPLHVWLPDAMEGPTPVSALIHAATMVAAGVYLVARIFPILTPDARLFIAIIGCTTLTMAALIAIAQSDIKKVLAFSTLSQLGYMILAMGVGSWVGALFHLITHAFFKALLFLGSGSVIHAAHHEQEMPQYGGLLKKIPVTGVTFAVAVLAISGFSILGVGFSGFYSKDMILAHAAAFGHLAEHEHLSKFYWLLFAMPVFIAFVTPFYMTRCWMLTFAGKPRNHHLHEHAHESPILWAPLVVLMVLSIVGGYEWMNIKGLIESAVRESTRFVTQTLEAPAFAGFGQAWSSAEPAHGDHSILGEGWHTMHTWVGWAPWVGIGLGVLLYWNGYAVANRLMRITPLRWIHTWLLRRMYIDELYGAVIVAGTMGFSKLCSALDKHVVDRLVNWAALVVKNLSGLAGVHDKYVVDGAVSGVAAVTRGLGTVSRAPQTGRIRFYVTALLAIVAIGIAVATVATIAWAK